MSKSFYIFLLLIFNQILHSNANGSRRAGKGKPSTTRGVGSRGVGSSVVGESSAGSSSSVNETQNTIPLVEEVLKDVADFSDYKNCIVLINDITNNPGYSSTIINQNKQLLERLLKKKRVSNRQIIKTINKIASDEEIRAEIRLYCKEGGDKILNEIPEKTEKAKRIIVFNEAVAKNQEKCPICHENYNEDDDIQMTKCTHFYHKKCTVKWYIAGRGANHDKCPSCRAHLETSSHPYFKKLDKKLEPLGLRKKATVYIKDD